jgi:TP901 family phage tail tape measure protein
MASPQNLVLQLLITARDTASDVLERIRQSIGSIGDVALTVAKAGIAALVAGIAAMGAAFAQGLRNAADFETVMARIQASGVSSAAELKKVADAAKQMGKDTGAGATEAAVGLEGLIKAGLSTTEAIGTLPNILALASGQMLAMDEATALVIKTVNQFGLSFADSKKVVDTLATGANVAATSVQELAQGLENSGLQARQAGLSLQETVAALNTLMQNGQDAAGAGEALQSMLLELSDVSGPAREALRSVGVATGDFNAILQLLAQGGPQASAVLGAFGETALTAAGILGNALPFYQEQVKQIKAVGVSAQEAADIMGKTFNDQVKSLNATWQEFWQTLAEPTLPALTASLKTLTGFINDNRQALSDWITLGFAPVTASIDGVRLGIAAWNGDTEKANQIQAQMNERLTAIQRALTGTSAEYAKAQAATEGQKTATEGAAQATERQQTALLALQDAIREHTAQAKEAAAGSELQAFHTEQARLAQAQYDAELKKGLPTAQQHATAQQAVGKSLSELHVAYQVAAAMVERLTEQNRKGLATDQQVTEAKLAKARAEKEYTSAAKLGTEAAEKNLKILQAEAPTIEAVSTARLAEQQTILKLAQARGDEQKAAEAQLAITTLEIQQATDLALNKTQQAVETAKLLNAKKAEYALTIQSNAGQQEEIRLLEETVKQKLAESDAAWEGVRAREKEIRQAEIMAGPVGELIRLYQKKTAELDRETSAIERSYAGKQRDLEVEIAQAEAKGDTVKVQKLKIEKAQAEADMAQAVADAKKVELQAEIDLIEAKKLALLAEADLNEANKEKLVQMDEEIAKLKDLQDAEQDKADSAQAAADEAKNAASATKKVTEETDKATESTEKLSVAYAKLGDAVAIAFDVGGIQAYNQVIQQIQSSINHANDLAQRLADEGMGAIAGSAASAALSVESMASSLENSESYLNDAARAAADQLRGALASAREEAEGLSESLKDMAADFEKEMLRIRGDERALLELEHQENLANLEAMAERAGSIATDEYNLAKRRAEELHRLKMEQLEQESQGDKATTRLNDLATAAERAGSALREVSRIDLDPINAQAERLHKSFSDLNGVL